MKDIILDINIFEFIQKAYEEHFDRKLNKIGCSEIPMGMRRTLIARLFNIPIPMNMNMLHGKIHHAVLQQPEIIKSIITSISNQIGLDNPPIDTYIPEKVISYNFNEKQGIEGHIDVYTPDFLIEIKTTSIPLKFYSKEIAPYHFLQLNTYLGIEGIQLGFLLSMNLQAYNSRIINLNEVMRKYAYIVPVEFDQEIFDLTLERARFMLDCLEKGIYNVPCPEYSWECKNCPKEIQEICNHVKESEMK